jgi:hypothetical protein
MTARASRTHPRLPCLARWVSGKGGSVRAGYDHARMPRNFIGCDREQVFLLPPSLGDWLPVGHLVWTVLAAAEEMELSAFIACIGMTGTAGRRMSRR